MIHAQGVWRITIAGIKQTSMRHVAPSPSQAIDLARPCITWKGQVNKKFTFIE